VTENGTQAHAKAISRAPVDPLCGEDAKRQTRHSESGSRLVAAGALRWYRMSGETSPCEPQASLAAPWPQVYSRTKELYHIQQALPE